MKHSIVAYAIARGAHRGLGRLSPKCLVFTAIMNGIDLFKNGPAPVLNQSLPDTPVSQVTSSHSINQSINTKLFNAHSGRRIESNLRREQSPGGLRTEVAIRCGWLER